MDDRELLEAAARAAGLKARFLESHAPGLKLFGEDRPWNPLDDDGDALRLAVQLHIGVRSNSPTHWQNPSITIALFSRGEDDHGRLQQAHEGDPCAATRRAIVRAAAQLGPEKS